LPSKASTTTIIESAPFSPDQRLKSTGGSSVRVVTEEQTFRVLLVGGAGDFTIAGNWVYLAEALPRRKQVIEVQALGDPKKRRRCRVSRLQPDSEFPIRATEIGDD
jgi:hypothetical protein